MQTVKRLAHILWCSISEPILKYFVKKIYNLPIAVKMAYPSSTCFVSAPLTPTSISPSVSYEESEENDSYWFTLGLLRIWHEVSQLPGSFWTRGIISRELKLCPLWVTYGITISSCFPHFAQISSLPAHGRQIIW